ncbi:MAG TPA: threonine/serine exporter family protein [Steroidobacteraceae bacterium]|nr:threonine/serine exporter family protein [Steroidobacteraceae bacterium]
MTRKLETHPVIPAAEDEISPQASPKAALAFLSHVAQLLFLNGQTTQRTVVATCRLAKALNFGIEVFPRWGELTVRLWDQDGPHDIAAPVAPTNVNMGKVSAVMTMIDGLDPRGFKPATAQVMLQEALNRVATVSMARFIIMAAAGAAALGVIFGATDPLGMILIAGSAGLGAALRRRLMRISENPLLPPFAAALLAGIIGAVATNLHVSSPQRLIAVCPCMVLVPGPHLLNGALDLARTQISLGLARVTYASVIILMICAGLLLGLAMGGDSLSVSGDSSYVPLFYDVIAAGVAVAAYGTFFSMSWRMVPVPVAIGMLAHAARWFIVVEAGHSVEVGALLACFIVSVLVTPIADRLHLPFAGIAFASVVSLIPGVFLFRMGGGLLALVTLGAQAPAGLLQAVVADGATAFVVVLAMAFGLIIPKLCIDHFRHGHGA